MVKWRRVVCRWCRRCGVVAACGVSVVWCSGGVWFVGGVVGVV